AAEPALQARSHLLSISFDPKHDTPEVLRRYGRAFVGDGPRPFAHWEFASGPDSEIRKLGGFLGLDYDPDQGMWVHNLRTAVVGPDGTLVRSIRGSDWKPEELVADLRAAAGAAKGGRPRAPPGPAGRRRQEGCRAPSAPRSCAVPSGRERRGRRRSGPGSSSREEVPSTRGAGRRRSPRR